MKKILVIGLVGESVFMNCDHFHKNGETIICENIYDEIGGKGFNQALAIKTLGGNVKFISCIGNDNFGTKCVNDTQELGLEYIYFNNSDRTAYANILIDNNGNNRVSVFPGAKLNEIHLIDIYRQIDSVDILLLQLELADQITKEIIKYAKNQNKYIILNPAPCKELKNEYLLCDLLIPNEIEAITLFGRNYIKKINELNLNVIVTLGDKGSIHVNNNIVEEYASVKTDAVDTTGAGDIFCGSIAYYLSKEFTIEAAIKQANINASKSVKHKYVIPGILSLKNE